MIAHRATIAAAAAAALLSTAAPAAAQVSETIVLNIMRECAKIGDPTARLACYDNNIRAAGGAPQASTFGQPPVAQNSGSPVSPNTPQGFGAEAMRTQQRVQTPSDQLRKISTRVTAIKQRSPGVYQFTLEDGAQWLFADSVGPSYRIPRAGSTVEIERGALGGFLLRFDSQAPVGVRRVQ